MTLNEKVTMKDLLSEGLYILMQQSLSKRSQSNRFAIKQVLFVELSIIILWISMRPWNI